MKKCICIIQVILIVLGVLTLSACGSKPAEQLDPEATFDALLSDVKYADELNDVSGNAKYYFEGMPEGTEIKMYCTGGSSYNDRVILLKAKDEKSVDAVVESVNKHIDGLKKQAELYSPEETSKLKNSVVYVSGSNVFVCITDDTDTVHKILGD